MKPLLVMQTGDAPQAIRQELANFEGMFQIGRASSRERVYSSV